jgi:hypothetical protein
LFEGFFYSFTVLCLLLLGLLFANFKAFKPNIRKVTYVQIPSIVLCWGFSLSTYLQQGCYHACAAFLSSSFILTGFTLYVTFTPKFSPSPAPK